MSDPKAKFKKYVGAESGGGRPEGKGFITELQRQKLKPAHLEVIVTKNKERNHYPKRVSNEKWLEVKAELKRKQYQTKQAEGKNQKLKGIKLLGLSRAAADDPAAAASGVARRACARTCGASRTSSSASC